MRAVMRSSRKQATRALASARLAAGERPSSEAIAARAIRVATCDLV
jgi:hypothetical protein